MKTTLTTGKALEIFDGIATIIKGYEAIVPGPDGKDRAVPVAYKIDGQTTMRLRMNFKNLETFAKSFEETRGDLIKRLAHGGTALNAKANPNEFTEYLGELNKMMADSHEVDIYRVDADKLTAKNDNMLPILMKLGPILNESALND